MRSRSLSILRLPDRLRARTRRSWQVLAAVRWAKALTRDCTTEIFVCWDLDNTLVDSGSLIRAGRTLEQAIVEAYPVPNMLAFYEAMHAALPGAEHFILSARGTVMRPDTLAWFQRHGLEARGSHVCLVPDASVKPRIWRQLASSGRLVIVDDLSFNHEAEQPTVYHDLAETASRLASAYIGLPQITRIATDGGAAPIVARQAADALMG